MESHSSPYIHKYDYQIRDDEMLTKIVHEANELYSDNFGESFEKFEYAVTHARALTNFRLEDEDQIEFILPDRVHNLAHVLRLYALKMFLHEKINQTTFDKTRELITEAILLYEQFSPVDRFVKREKRFAYYQLQKLAYKLQNGELLEDAAKKLLKASRLNRNNTPMEDNLTFKTYEALFFIALSKLEVEKAEYYLERCRNFKQMTINRANNIIRHEIFLSFIKLEYGYIDKNEKENYFVTRIENRFKKFLDKRIQGLINANDNVSAKSFIWLNTDLHFLFILQCKKLTMCLERNETVAENELPIKYVLNKALSFYKKEDHEWYKSLRARFYENKKGIIKHQCINLDKKFFGDISELKIIIPANIGERLFPLEKNHSAFFDNEPREKKSEKYEYVRKGCS